MDPGRPQLSDAPSTSEPDPDQSSRGTNEAPSISNLSLSDFSLLEYESLDKTPGVNTGSFLSSCVDKYYNKNYRKSSDKNGKGLSAVPEEDKTDKKQNEAETESSEMQSQGVDSSILGESREQILEKTVEILEKENTVMKHQIDKLNSRNACLEDDLQGKQKEILELYDQRENLRQMVMLLEMGQNESVTNLIHLVHEKEKEISTLKKQIREDENKKEEFRSIVNKVETEPSDITSISSIVSSRESDNDSTEGDNPPIIVRKIKKVEFSIKASTTRSHTDAKPLTKSKINEDGSPRD